jgi:hypothetical protein
MILLKNRVLPWSETKKLMSNGDRFLNMLLDFDPDSITQQQITMLRPCVPLQLDASFPL